LVHYCIETNLRDRSLPSSNCSVVKSICNIVRVSLIHNHSSGMFN
jgi:hypothetical protein